MAIDESGYPINVPKFVPDNEEDRLLEEVAEGAKTCAKRLDEDFEKKLGWK
jgi:hypothetical protein